MTNSRTTVWVLLALTLGLGVAAGPSLKTMQDRDVSIVEFQLARTSEKAAEINTKLGDEGLDALRTSLWWDMPFLVCLGLLLAILCIRTGRRAAELGQTRTAVLARVFAGLAIVYLVTDLVEDVLSFQVADGDTGQPWPGLIFAIASVKFLAMFASVIYLLVAAVRRRGAPAAA